MDHIIDRDISIEQAAMRIIVSILPVEEETTAALRIKVPEQHAHASFSKKAGQVHGCCGFSDASLDVIYGDLFQKMVVAFSELKTNHKMMKATNNCSLLFSIGLLNSIYHK